MNDRFVEDIKSRVDLVEIVRKYAEVKKSGKNFMCKSPFRNERTPSFSISPEKQMWYDFGAAEGGDTISFIEKIENCSFREALEVLADIAGVEIPKDFNDGKGPSKEQKKDIFQLHKKAVEFFAKELQKNEKAKKYCVDRGLTDGMVKNWDLGYGGEDASKNAMSKFLLGSGFSEKLIQESGVAFEREFGSKSMVDRFWGRLMIPIAEPREGQIIAFSGRDILDRKKVGKYVNSPENPVYHKSATLFGLDRARKSIKETDRVILVEGNLDVIFAHERGFPQTVATCGTALTEDHLRILRRFTSNFYLAFDTDLAGKKATLKAAEMCLKMELNPSIVDLGTVKDFGDFLAEEKNASALKSIIEKSPPALEFFLERFAVKYLDGSMEGEKKFLDSFFYFLKLVTRPIEVDEFLARIAKKISRSKSVVEAEFQKFSSQKANYQKPKYQEETSIHFTREESFVGFLLAYWEDFSLKIIERKEDFLVLFAEDVPRRILQKKLESIALEDAETQQTLAWQMWQENSFQEAEPDLSVKKEMFRFFVQKLREEQQKKERVKAAKQIKLNS